MTQQPYYGTPQDPYNPQPPQQYPPAGYQQVPNGYAPAPQGYQPAPQYGPAPGGYPGQQNPQHQAPQGPPAPVGAKGTIDGFFNQPSSGGGKGISWKNKPIPYTYIGVVKKTPTDGDLFQDSDPQTKTLKTWRDGSPKMVMPVQIHLIPTDQWQAQEYCEAGSPVGDAAFYLRGQLRDETVRAMAESGETGVPQVGALVQITLTQRKPGNNIATNITSVTYLPAGTWEQEPQFAHIAHVLASGQSGAPSAMGAPQQAPYQQQAPAQYATPAQATPNPQQYAQPQYGAAPAYDPNQYQQPAQQNYQGPAPTQQSQAVQYAPNPQAPVNQGPAPQYGMPAAQPNPQQAPAQGQLPGMPPVPPQAPPVAGAMGAPDPHKAALIAQLQGQQQAPNPQQ